MKGQKEAVVELVKATLGVSFKPNVDVAANLLTADQLESIKTTIGTEIIAGNIDYGKDRSKTGEVMAYARSMVMNHLKKAKELNGGQAYSSSKKSAGSPAKAEADEHDPEIARVRLELLPSDLKEYVETL